MIDFLVFSAAGVLVAMVVAWMLRPDLRQWIEQPKYQFLEQAIRYDKSQEVSR